MIEPDDNWVVEPIEHKPDYKMHLWSIKFTTEGNYFVGSGGSGISRISGLIKTYDPVSFKGTAFSGITYQLVGDAGSTEESEFAWKKMVEEYGIEELTL
jgi:hypothetical protein